MAYIDPKFPARRVCLPPQDSCISGMMKLLQSVHKAVHFLNNSQLVRICLYLCLRMYLYIIHNIYTMTCVYIIFIYIIFQIGVFSLKRDPNSSREEITLNCNHQASFVVLFFFQAGIAFLCLKKRHRTVWIARFFFRGISTVRVSRGS